MPLPITGPMSMKQFVDNYLDAAAGVTLQDEGVATAAQYAAYLNVALGTAIPVAGPMTMATFVGYLNAALVSKVLLRDGVSRIQLRDAASNLLLGH